MLILKKFKNFKKRQSNIMGIFFFDSTLKWQLIFYKSLSWNALVLSENKVGK